MGHRAIRDRFLIAFAALLALLPAQAQAWGFYAHRTTAAIAMENVRPETRAGIARLLRSAPELGVEGCDLASLEDASTWPDCLRKDYWRWGYTFAWHYRTAPVCEAYEPRANCSGQNCILAQIVRNQLILSDESLPDETALTQEDIGRAIPISQKRVTQAGIRMAEYLDAAFAPGALQEPERD